MAIAGISLGALAQQQPVLDSENVIAPADFMRILVPPDEVEGRAYLFDDWQQGEVFLSQGKYASGITFNYDVLNHALLVLVDKKEFSLNPIAVDSILMANRSQVLINPIILDGIDTDRLLLRVYEGIHVSLFRSTAAKKIAGDNNTTTSVKLKYVEDTDIQVNQEQTFILFDKSTKKLREIPEKKKELKKWENGDQLADFVKNQNLDLKIEADLILLVQYYQQLMYDES